ncbi:cilia- and flagella-associated protein 161-like isoform X2 [Schistocerca gregaria]|uniref:cilia- and flagella-associated protein 161-like isoform X2 n=1 Tax=Schistocerca gregaria TaxID=7010 RepID=UPI00211E805D|nr:cilia- and flagella-associated protein 161-like isoform X2 [Schistocerca gregaria]XP_049832698.1 cilia- and flagella-associated protein 161-like isoform X2 [Schistocerca gregaria]
MDRPKYSSSVRIGNWNEELYSEEAGQQLFLKKRERGELLVQKARKLFFNLLREVELAPAAEWVRFGDVVQLLATDFPVALSTLITERQVDRAQQLVTGSPLVCSKLTTPPCFRNTFRIRSEHGDDTRNGEPVKFNQDFVLCPVESYGNLPLFVESRIPQINIGVGASGFAAIMLSCYNNTCCRWRALYWDSSKRPESEGSPVPPHSKILINHSASNRNLAVEPRIWFPTFFGMECEVSVHTCKDAQRRETAENHWMFGIQKPDDMKVACSEAPSTTVDQPKGESQQPDPEE